MKKHDHTPCICVTCEDRRIDSARLDALEAYVNKLGALVIHTGEADCGKHTGLGLRPGNLKRSLRKALDDIRKTA